MAAEIPITSHYLRKWSLPEYFRLNNCQPDGRQQYKRYYKAPAPYVCHLVGYCAQNPLLPVWVWRVPFSYSVSFSDASVWRKSMQCYWLWCLNLRVCSSEVSRSRHQGEEVFSWEWKTQSQKKRCKIHISLACYITHCFSSNLLRIWHTFSGDCTQAKLYHLWWCLGFRKQKFQLVFEQNLRDNGSKLTIGDVMNSKQGDKKCMRVRQERVQGIWRLRWTWQTDHSQW